MTREELLERIGDIRDELEELSMQEAGNKGKTVLKASMVYFTVTAFISNSGANSRISSSSLKRQVL